MRDIIRTAFGRIGLQLARKEHAAFLEIKEWGKRNRSPHEH